MSRPPTAIVMLLACLAGPVAAQPYTQPLWAVDTVRNITYGWDTTYLGGVDTLRLDLFRPVGDGNAQRPLLIAVHGGAWIGGYRQDLWTMCHEAAQRGYVAATISYRLRHHVPDGISISLGVDPCVYLPDSAELLRALFRAQQDLKGAIRHMKGRSALDSTNTCNVYLYGESAGAITSLTAAFLDEADERPAACGALTAAPEPAFLLGGCHVTGLPLSAAQRSRPDLGPVDGDLEQNGHDARVAGIAAMYGGLPTLGVTEDWVQGTDTPAVFFYHQPCDAIVPNGTRPLLRDISAYCASGTWWSAHYPSWSGSHAVAPLLGERLLANVQDNTVCDWVLSQFPFSFNCVNMGQNGSFHYVNNAPAVRDSIFRSFSPLVIANEQSPCGASTMAPPSRPQPLLFPVPAEDVVHIRLAQNSMRTVTATLLDAVGRTVLQARLTGGTGTIAVGDLPSGSYLVVFDDPEQPAVRVAVLH